VGSEMCIRDRVAALHRQYLHLAGRPTNEKPN
jgi:hypothetical protein